MDFAQSDFIANYETAYQQMFYVKYQATGRLRNTTRLIRGIVGSSFEIPTADQLQMQEYSAMNADIARQSLPTTATTLNFKNWVEKTSVSDFEQINLHASILQMHAEIHAKSVARREDQVILDACTTGAGAGGAKVVEVGTSNLTVEKLREAFGLLSKDEVEDNDMYCVIGWNQHQKLMGETEYSSSIFNAAKPLVNPNIAGMAAGMFLGFTIIILGDRTEGGLPKVGNVRDNYIFAKQAITTGYRMDPTTRMAPDESNARVNMLSKASFGSVVNDLRGLVTIKCDESA